MLHYSPNYMPSALYLCIEGGSPVSTRAFFETVVDKLGVKQPVHNVLRVRPLNHRVDWVTAPLRAPLGVADIVTAVLRVIPHQVVEDCWEVTVVGMAIFIEYDVWIFIRVCVSY